jgi:hypothetical protein
LNRSEKAQFFISFLETFMTNRFAHCWVIVAGLVIFTTASLEADQGLLSEAAKAINEAKSGQFEATVKLNQEGVPSMTMRTSWVADANRTEWLLGEKTVSWQVLRKGKFGMVIDRQSRTYSRTKAAKELTSSLSELIAMNRVPPEKVNDLGKKRIGKIDTRGFSTSLRNLAPDTGTEGTLSVWVDEDSRLPVLLVHEDQIHTARMEGFKWNVPLKPELFDVQPPDDYEDATRAPPNEKELAQIVGALKTYSAAYGHYPQVDVILGDVTSAALRKKLGIPEGEFGQAVVEHKDFPQWYEAVFGWSAMNVLHNQNSDFGYFGKSVGPKDAGKVLTHWKLEDESYRVIYGDLKTETVTAAKLPSLLEKK